MLEGPEGRWNGSAWWLEAGGGWREGGTTMLADWRKYDHRFFYVTLKSGITAKGRGGPIYVIEERVPVRGPTIIDDLYGGGGIDVWEFYRAVGRAWLRLAKLIEHAEA
jgi:hypothetical protein